MTATVRLTSEVRNWLVRKDRAVTVRASRRHGCCGGISKVPVAEAGVPGEPEEYRRERIEGIDVYVARELDTAATMTVRLESLLGCKRLFVEGAKVSGIRQE